MEKSQVITVGHTVHTGTTHRNASYAHGLHGDSAEETGEGRKWTMKLNDCSRSVPSTASSGAARSAPCGPPSVTWTPPGSNGTPAGWQVTASGSSPSGALPCKLCGKLPLVVPHPVMARTVALQCPSHVPTIGRPPKDQPNCRKTRYGSVKAATRNWNGYQRSAGYRDPVRQEQGEPLRPVPEVNGSATALGDLRAEVAELDRLLAWEPRSWS